MAITAASNTLSSKAQRQLANSSAELSKTYERLSSGLRINNASDDPAGLALSEGLRSGATIASMAVRNANDGLSVTAIADSALSEIGNILTRMAELAEQSSNGVYSTTQRSALDSEFQALGSEIERISYTTEFNDVKLLSGSNSIVLQIGFDAGSVSQITIQAVQGTLASLGLADTDSSALTYSINAATVSDAQSASQNALTAVNNAIGSLSNVRGLIGATESRLSHAINNLSIAKENFLTADSRIRDADIAVEAANMVRLQVLQQAGSAVLAQANQQPSRVLDLLK